MEDGRREDTVESTAEGGKFFTVDVVDKKGNLVERIYGPAESVGNQSDTNIHPDARFSTREEAEELLKGSAAENCKLMGYKVTIVEHGN